MSKKRHRRRGLTILGIAVLAFIAVPWTLVAMGVLKNTGGA
jgi:hypothetical protein